eukprot:2338009-Pleurochrysis_carterae.AAC.1
MHATSPAASSSSEDWGGCWSTDAARNESLENVGWHAAAAGSVLDERPGLRMPAGLALARGFDLGEFSKSSSFSDPSWLWRRFFRSSARCLLGETAS